MRLQEAERSKDEEDNEEPLSEKWFHGRLLRHEAEHLVRRHSHLGDGTFLVRTSDSFVGEYCLSFWGNGSVNHCLIYQDKQQTKYYLIDTQCFDSLYSLISHYQSHPLVTADFSITLREPVPQPKSHEGKKWYHQNTKKAQAEDVLKMVKIDGAFLVRPSEQNANAYTISFR